MNILEVLVRGSSSYNGQGINKEGEPFIGRLTVRALEGGRAALLEYTATLQSGEVVHAETTLLGVAQGGGLCLWPVMSEIPVIIPHLESISKSEVEGETKAVFSTGPRDDSTKFREEITITLGIGNVLRYAHAWALPVDEFGDRSYCDMQPSAA